MFGRVRWGGGLPVIAVPVVVVASAAFRQRAARP
jgi:hypothetical protein